MDQDQNPENSAENPQGCGCEPGCCEPKKPGLWKKLVFGLVLVIAAVIIIFKITHKPENTASGATTIGCDTTKCGAQSKCDTTKSCCPK